MEESSSTAIAGGAAAHVADDPLVELGVPLSPNPSKEKLLLMQRFMFSPTYLRARHNLQERFAALEARTRHPTAPT